MALEEYLSTRLLAYAGLTNLVSTRISPMHAIQSDELPCVTWQRAGGGLEYNHDGVEDITDPDWQIDVWAETFDGAVLAARQVMSALQTDAPPNFYAFLENHLHDYEPDTRRYRVMLLYRFLYRES